MEERNQSRGVVIAIVVVIAILVVLGLIFGWFGGGSDFERTGDDNISENGDMNQNLPEGLQVSDDVPGSGDVAQEGDLVRVHYRGMFEDGTVFDSSFERGEPLPFVLGAGQVIEGMERGVIGMREGGTRTLTIAPELAYGPEGFGQIPANATLIFEIELVSVETPTGDKL